MSLGLPRDVVEVVPYDSEWPKRFEEERVLLLEKFPGLLLEISHGGSTSVPGLSAKPIIDMFAIVRSLADAESMRSDLETLGYHYRGAEGIPGRILYAKGSERLRTHHLQVVERSSDQWENHILLRNYYRKYPETAAAYERLKKELGEKYPHDRKAYGKGKAGFIASVLEKARKEFEKK